jgi:hypothetical protein
MLGARSAGPARSGTSDGTPAGLNEAAGEGVALARAAERAISWRVLPVLLGVVVVSFIDRTKWAGREAPSGRGGCRREPAMRHAPSAPHPTHLRPTPAPRSLSFASLTMNADLGLSPATYGLGAGVFSLGYALNAVPSSVALVRFGAPSWLAALCVAWGVTAGAFAFVRSAAGFVGLRLLLGLCEVGWGGWGVGG